MIDTNFAFAIFKFEGEALKLVRNIQVRETITVSTIDGVKRVEVAALFDTGAKSTFIREGLAKGLGFTPYPKPIEIPLAIKGKTGEIGESTLVFTIAGCEIPFGYTVRVAKDLAEDVVIGSSLMEEFGVELDLKEGKARLKTASPELGWYRNKIGVFTSA